MSQQTNPYRNDVNPVSARKHRNEVLWQITLPFILLLLIFLALVVWIIVAGIRGNADALSTWADTSLIFLILPALLFILLFAGVFGGLTYGIVRLIGVLPGYAYKLNRLILRINDKVKSVSDTAAKPVIKTSSFWAAVREFLGR